MGEEWGRSHRRPFQWTGQEHLRTSHQLSWGHNWFCFGGGGFTTVSGHFWWRSGHQVVRGLQSLHTTRTCTLYSRMESPDTSSALPHAVTETGLRCGSFSFYFDQTLNFQNMNWFHTTCDPDLPPPTPPLQEENPSPATLPAVPHWRSTRADRRINS